MSIEVRVQEIHYTIVDENGVETPCVLNGFSTSGKPDEILAALKGKVRSELLKHLNDVRDALVAENAGIEEKMVAVKSTLKGLI